VFSSKDIQKIKKILIKNVNWKFKKNYYQIRF
jgi:hypothetical protein